MLFLRFYINHKRAPSWPLMVPKLRIKNTVMPEIVTNLENHNVQITISKKTEQNIKKKLAGVWDKLRMITFAKTRTAAYRAFKIFLPSPTVEKSRIFFCNNVIAIMQ